MIDLNPKAIEQGHDNQRTATSIATIWGVLLALVVGFELISLLMSRWTLAGVFH